jgi:purine-binding chemotaxis protein CheW
VLALPGVPTVTDVTRAPTAVREGGPSAGRRTLTVLRCGEYRLAIDASHVHTTIPTPDLRTSVLTSRMCPGTVVFDDREVPVVDPLVLLGLGELPRADTGAGLVLDLGSGYVVLALSELLELVHVGPEEVLDTPSFALPRPDLLAGMVQVAGFGDCLVLDGAMLLTDPQLSGFAAVNTATESLRSGDESTVAAAAAAASGAPAYLTYSIGLDLATPLEQISEILPFPDTLTRTSVPGMLGLLTHRRAVVPVLCLASLIGLDSRPVTPATCLLLVDVDGASVAFAVDALRSIDPLTWTDPDQVRTRGADQLERVLQTSPLVQVGGETRLLPGLDLQRVARAVRGPVVVPAPRAPQAVQLVAG